MAPAWSGSRAVPRCRSSAGARPLRMCRACETFLSASAYACAFCSAVERTMRWFSVCCCQTMNAPATTKSRRATDQRGDERNARARPPERRSFSPEPRSNSASMPQDASLLHQSTGIGIRRVVRAERDDGWSSARTAFHMPSCGCGILREGRDTAPMRCRCVSWSCRILGYAALGAREHMPLLLKESTVSFFPLIRCTGAGCRLRLGRAHGHVRRCAGHPGKVLPPVATPGFNLDCVSPFDQRLKLVLNGGHLLIHGHGLNDSSFGLRPRRGTFSRNFTDVLDYLEANAPRPFNCYVHLMICYAACSGGVASERGTKRRFLQLGVLGLYGCNTSVGQVQSPLEADLDQMLTGKISF